MISAILWKQRYDDRSDLATLSYMVCGSVLRLVFK